MFAAFGRGPFSNYLLRDTAIRPFPTLSMDFPAVVPTTQDADTDTADAAVADRVVRSYHHRLGRPPTLDELRAALGLEADGEPIQFQTPKPETYAPPSRPSSSTAAEEVIRSYRNRLGRPPSIDELRASLGLEADAAAPDSGPLPESDTGWSLIGAAQARSFDPKDPRAPKAIVTPLPGGGFAPPSSRETPTEPPAPWHSWRVVPEAYGKSLLLGFLLPAIAARRMIEWLRGEEINDAYAKWLEDRSDGALRAQAQAWDYWRSDPNRSHQTYTKEREDLGPCRDSEKLDPRSPCYYSGSTSGTGTAEENVLKRYADAYPSENYRLPVADCSTSSLLAVRAREQRLIDHFRRLGLSDNIANALADNIWRPYFEEMAQQQCGNNPLPMPRRR